MGNRSSSSSAGCPATPFDDVDSNLGVLDLVASSPVIVFSATYCSYCRIVKRVFSSLGTKIRVLELDQIGEERGTTMSQELAEITRQRTVPQVFICGKWIGGCEDTRRLLASGALEQMIKNCCNGDITCGSH